MKRAPNHTITILQSAVFDAEVFSSYVKNVGDCDHLCHQLAKVKIENIWFEERLLKAREGLKRNGSVLFQRDFFQLL